MEYKALVLDVDGTLVAHGERCARPEVAAAVQEVQRRGVKIVIATGRTYFAMAPEILGGIRPDYAVCANGAQVLDGRGRLLASKDFTPEEMYAWWIILRTTATPWLFALPTTTTCMWSTNA